jgi:hypothetical protein
MKQAGLGSVQAISESRAALLGAGIPYDRARANVLIIDVGSSTTDLTYLRELSVQADALTELGHNSLGGGLVDEALLELMLKKSSEHAAISRAFATDPSARLRALYAVRKAKEDYFTNEAVYRQQSLISYHVVSMQPRLLLDIEIDHATMQQVLNQPLTSSHNQDPAIPRPRSLSWVQAYRELLTDARSDARLAQFDTVVLTGGASRMGVVQEITREIFFASHVLVGPEPELAVAKGLAKARRLDHQTSAFSADARDTLNEAFIRSAVDKRFPLWQDLVVGIYVDRLKAILIEALINWRDSTNTQMTLRDMQDQIRESVSLWLDDPDTHVAIASSFLEWSNRVLVDLRPTLMSLMERNFIPIAQIDLNPIPPRADLQSLDNFRFFGGVGELTRPALQGITAALASLVGFSIDALLVGATHGLVGITMGLAGIVFGGKGEGKFAEWMSTIPIKARLSPTLLSTILSDKRIASLVEKQEPALRKELTMRLDGAERGRIEARVSDAVNNALESIADQARLIIAGA